MEMYPLEQALMAQKALREAAGLGPELFPVQTFVGMISDEIEQLRSQGKTDAQIAAMVEAHSSIRISAAEIAEHYASPEQRHFEHE